MFLKKNNEGSIIQLSKCIEECDAIIIGAGSGLSTAAGLTYAGERFEKYFSDKKLTYEEVIDRDLRIIQNSMQEKIINEGIRAKIIEKDNNPNWPHKSLEEVPMDDIKKLLDLEKTYKENID